MRFAVLARAVALQDFEVGRIVTLEGCKHQAEPVIEFRKEPPLDLFEFEDSGMGHATGPPIGPASDRCGRSSGAYAIIAALGLPEKLPALV